MTAPGIHQRLPAQNRRPSGTIGCTMAENAVSPARSAAFEILLRVEREESYAAELLHSARLAKLSSRDHGLATELVMGVLRWQSLLDQRLAAASSQKLDRLDGEVLAALRLGVYQLQFLSRVPAHAAIFESVELVKAARKRSAAPFVNAVLRTIAGRWRKRSSRNTSSRKSTNHPTRSRWPRTLLIPCGWWNAGPSTMDLKQRGRSAHMIRRCPTRPFTFTTIYLIMGKLMPNLPRLACSFRRVDCYRLHDAFLRAMSPERGPIRKAAYPFRMKLRNWSRCWPGVERRFSIVAPLPAARLRCSPGATRALKCLRQSCILIARACCRDLSRSPNIHVVAADARHLPFSYAFDRILADVPCSGTGTLARNPEIKWRLKAADLHDLQSRQVAILKSALRPACDWRAACLFHVFAGTRGKRSGGGSCARWHGGIQGRRFEGRAGATAAVWRDSRWTGYRVASRWSLSKNNSRRTSVRRIFRRDDRARKSIERG